MAVVRFTPIPDTDRVRLDYAFDRSINEIVKSMPVRGFEPDGKFWWVHERYAEELANHLGAAGHDVLGPEETERAAAEATIEDFFGAAAAKYDYAAKARDILADIPPEHRHKVFRAMGREMYPELKPQRR